MRISLQTILPPIITASLYFIIFGSLIGSQIQNIKALALCSLLLWFGYDVHDYEFLYECLLIFLVLSFKGVLRNLLFHLVLIM